MGSTLALAPPTSRPATRPLAAPASRAKTASRGGARRRRPRRFAETRDVRRAHRASSSSSSSGDDDDDTTASTSAASSSSLAKENGGGGGGLARDGDGDVDVDFDFDVDDATSAWILARFAFIWIACGYLTVPSLAAIERVDAPSSLPAAHLGCALLLGESAKALATTTMLRAELRDVEGGGDAMPWTRYRRRRGGGAAAADGLRTTTRGDVLAGVAFGVVASIAGRVADVAANGTAGAGAGAGGDAAAAPDGLLSLLAASSPVATTCLALSSLLVAPALEELFFRGYVLPATARRVRSPVLSVSLTSALFASAHFRRVLSSHRSPYDPVRAVNADP